jgi:hypothetical protein
MKKLINIKIFPLFVLLALLFSIFLYKTPVRAASIAIIAASNSTSAWKSQATATCIGSNDQSTINKYLTSGNTVELAPGTFSINGLIVLTSGNTLYGQGNTTILNMVGNNGGIYSAGVSNLTVYSLEIAGKEYSSGGIFIAADGSSVSNFYVHDITDIALGGDDFVLYADNGTISNASFVRCDANKPDEFGFLVNGAGSPSTIVNTAYFQCTVENAAVAATRANIWATGFDLAEYGSMTVKNEYVIDCSVNGAWESDFHYEASPTKTNCVIIGSSASNGGEKPGALYGAGYLVDGRSDTILYNNTASGNSVAALRAWNGTAYVNITPVANEIYPSTSIKTDAGVSQGNCSGIIINTDATHEELILYSTDGNPVNQQLPLGGYYASNDGNTYTFNGTSIVAQFTNYAIIGLVKSNSTALAVTTTALPNGTVGTSYSLNLAATGGTAPYTWKISSGSLPTGLSLSSNGVISGTATTSNSPIYVTLKVTDQAGATATSSLSITISGSSGQTLVFNPISNQMVAVGTSLKFALSATHAPGITLQYSADNMPSGASLQTDNIFRWTPIASQVGTYPNIYFQVSDGTSVASQYITITVTNSVTLMITTSSLPNGSVGTAYSQTLAATGGSSPYTSKITSGTLPTGLSLSSSGVISGTPTTAGGPTSITFQVTDNTGTSATSSLSITINGSSVQALVFNPMGNQTVSVGSKLKFTLSATDAAGKTLQYSADNMPSGASLQSDNIFRWTPTASQVGTYPNIYFQVSDGTSIAYQYITITVTN